MTRHDDSIRLRHMLDHAREAVEIAAWKNAKIFKQIVYWNFH